MKCWEIKAMDGTKSEMMADDVQVTPTGVALFIKISETMKDDNGKPVAEICGVAGNTFRTIEEIPPKLVVVEPGSNVINIDTNAR